MISIGKVSNGGYSKHVQDNTAEGAAEYYAGEAIPSEWNGAMAAQQGRSGEVEKSDLIDALNGKVTDATGERILSEERSNWTAGYDVTVSAPKSVCIEALVHGNDAAMDAHREAVSAVLDKLQDGIGARVTEGGKTQHETTGNMQAASFEHHMSASGDPHLHTHNVISNATICEDGKARAIDAKESVYGRVEELNKTYNDALEKGLQERGIATYRDERGQPQIEGYDKEGMRAFSERQNAMDAALKERGTSYDAASQSERELARQDTRKEIDRAEIKERGEATAAWRDKADQVREQGAKVGPGEKVADTKDAGKGSAGLGGGKEVSDAEKTAERTGYSREEFREAKFAVNEGRAAEARLESGNFRNDAHKQELEKRVERMEQIKAEKPDLYARAEKAVEKMGARDSDQRIDAAAMKSAQREAGKTADRAVGELNTAKWTVGKAQEAKEQLSNGHVKSEVHREQLQERVDKEDQLKRQDPALHAKAEHAWNQEFREAKHLVRSEKDADQRLSRGNFFSEQHKEDLQSAKAAAQEMREKQPAMMGMAERSVERENRGKAAAEGAKDKGGERSAGRGKNGGDSGAAAQKPGADAGDRKAQFRENVQTLRDADLAARALKSDNGLAFGFGRKDLTAKDREKMEKTWNSRGDMFYIDKKGNVYAAGLNGKEPGTFSKKEDSLFGLGSKEYIVNQKGDVFVRGAGITGGIQQKFADSLKGDGKGWAGKVWNNTVQDAFGAKWKKVEGRDADRMITARIEVVKEFFNARNELREQLRRDVKEAATAISERPKEMAKAYEAAQNLRTKDSKGNTHERTRDEVKVGDKGAQKELEKARADLGKEKEQGSFGGRSGGGSDHVSTVASAARGELARDLSTKADREKATEQVRERERIERERERAQERIEATKAQQQKIDTAGKPQGAEVKNAHERAADQLDKQKAEKERGRDSSGQDSYARQQAEKAVEERHIKQDVSREMAAGNKGPGAAKDDLKELRAIVDKLADSAIRQAGHNAAQRDEARGMDAARADREAMEKFVAKYGTVQQKEEMSKLLERADKFAALEKKEEREKEAQREKERSMAARFGD